MARTPKKPKKASATTDTPTPTPTPVWPAVSPAIKTARARAAEFARLYERPDDWTIACGKYRAAESAHLTARVSLVASIAALRATLRQGAAYFASIKLSITLAIEAVIDHDLGVQLTVANRSWLLGLLELSERCERDGTAFNPKCMPAGILADLIASRRRYKRLDADSAQLADAVLAASTVDAEGRYPTRQQWRLVHFRESDGARRAKTAPASKPDVSSMSGAELRNATIADCRDMAATLATMVTRKLQARDGSIDYYGASSVSAVAQHAIAALHAFKAAVTPTAAAPAAAPAAKPDAPVAPVAPVAPESVLGALAVPNYAD